MSKYFDLDFAGRSKEAKTVRWHNSDSEKNYVRLGNHYNPESFDYTFNGQGFRSDEFNNEPSLVFIGCSNTEGIGLPLEESWAYQVWDGVGRPSPFINLGIGGAGYDTMSRVLYLLQDQVKPKVAVVLLPGIWRRELVIEDKFSMWSPVTPLDVKKITNQILFDDEWVRYQAMKNLVMMDMIFEKYGTTVIWDSWYQHSKNDIADCLEMDKLKTFQHRVSNSFSKYVYAGKFTARDKIHPGSNENTEYAKDFLREYGGLIQDSFN